MMAEVAANQTLSTPATQTVDPKAAPATPAATEKIAPSLSILVQREKKALELERKAKVREQEYATRSQSLAEREAKLKEFEELWEKNPLKAIEARGSSYKALTELAMNDGNVPVEHEVKKLKDELDAIRKSQEDGVRQQAEGAKRQAEADEAKVIENFKGEISKYLEENAKKYELTIFDGKQDLVYEVIDEHFTRTFDQETGRGEILSKDAAADKVEKWLRETKYAKAPELEFFKSTLSPQQPKPEVKQELKFSPKPSRTLTNQLSATPAPARTRPMTDDERVAKAIAYAKGLRP